MADDQEMSGGTLGASEWLTTHHTYSESELSKIREFWTPSDQWRGEIESLLSLDKLDALDESRSEFEKIKADRLSGKSNFEELATTFLRRSSSAVGKASGTMQKAYIQRVQELATDLSALLQEPSIRGTPADLFALARRNMDPNFVFKVEMELLTDLAMISMLANIRLRNRTLPDEEVVHAIVDKTTYDRFRFASGAINFYERSTGKTATGWVDGSKQSEAIGFLMAIMNPVLQSVGQPQISAESARKEIQEVKKAFGAGVNPNEIGFGTGRLPGT